MRFESLSGIYEKRSPNLGSRTYSGSFYRDFVTNASGFPRSQLEMERMRLTFNASFALMRENYEGAFFRPHRVDVEMMYPGLLSGRDWGAGTKIFVEDRLTSLVADPGTVPIRNRGDSGIWDLASGNRGIIGGYDAWHTTPVGDYHGRGEKSSKDSHYVAPRVSGGSFSQELPYTRDGGFTQAQKGLESRFAGYM